MKRGCVAITDAAHARIFTYGPRDGEEPWLREELDLVNAGRQAHGKFTDTKPGNRWQEGGRGSTDDHRDDHLATRDRRFARLVIEEVARIVEDRAFPDVLLLASPKMLGKLRNELGRLRCFRALRVRITELAQDLAWMTPAQLHDHLAAMNLIGPRPRVTYRG